MSHVWKGDGEFRESTQSSSTPTKPEDQLEQSAPACCSWRRWMLSLLPFFPFTAAIALTLHYITCECRTDDFYICLRSLLSLPEPVSHLFFHLPAPPCSVFFLGGSVEFPNLSFSSELTDSTSPQFRLQAQALNHYVSETVSLPLPHVWMTHWSSQMPDLHAPRWSWSSSSYFDMPNKSMHPAFLSKALNTPPPSLSLLSLLSYSVPFSLSALPSLVCLFFFFFISLLTLLLLLSVSPFGCVKCKAETGAVHSVVANLRDPQGTGSFQSWGQAHHLWALARLRQQEWEEEQALNKNIVCAAFTQSATMSGRWACVWCWG